MEKSFKLLPPTMPNFIFYERPPRPREEGVNFEANRISITELSEREALEFAELIKTEFIRHWTNKVKSNPTKQKQ